MAVPLIYNLFPRLAGPIPHWLAHARRAAEMGFNWLYVNPFHYPGFSGSLYAVKDYYQLNPDFLPGGADPTDLGLLGDAVKEVRELGLAPMMDLVINHTAKDSPLTVEHPEWYVREDGQLKSPSAIDPADATKVTIWGDLAEIDNDPEAAHRQALWGYWTALTERYLELGFRGFRADAAYKVPAELWTRLIGAAKRREPQVRFFAETLGCRLEEVAALREAGFDYLFNSSKWWDFHESWALEQHEAFRRIAPSISFPESHDTPRLAAEAEGNELVLRQRYAFAAVFSAGLMMPIGYELGFRRQLDVVRTRPADWEETGLDFRGCVERINRIKLAEPLLQTEGVYPGEPDLDQPVLVLERWSDQAGSRRGYVIVNKDLLHPRPIEPPAPGRLIRLMRDWDPPQGEPAEGRLELHPAEVCVLIG